LNEILKCMTEEDYSRTLSTLHGASIGQHARHIIEFVDCLLLIQENETISYDDRKRDTNLERNLNDYLSRSNDFIHSLYQKRDNFPLRIKFYLDKDLYTITDSNYFREELFVLDHTIHHLAIIKIGITENFPDLRIPAEFGFTASTIRAKNLIPS